MKACKSCNRIVKSGNQCDNCKTETLSDDWNGYVVILNPESSEIAKKMNIEKPGNYALKVR